MATSDEILKAEAEHQTALTNVKKCIPGRAGFGIEAVYGQTYQRLVLLGARPQIRRKYRGR